MKKSILFLGFVALFAALSSCSKDDFLTTADQNAKELKEFVDENYLPTAHIFISRGDDWEQKEHSSAYRIESPYIITYDSGNHYYLGRLIFFEVHTGANNVNILALYFK